MNVYREKGLIPKTIRVRNYKSMRQANAAIAEHNLCTSYLKLKGSYKVFETLADYSSYVSDHAEELNMPKS